MPCLSHPASVWENQTEVAGAVRSRSGVAEEAQCRSGVAGGSTSHYAGAWEEAKVEVGWHSGPSALASCFRSRALVNMVHEKFVGQLTGAAATRAAEATAIRTVRRILAYYRK